MMTTYIYYFLIFVGTLLGGAIEYMYADQWLQQYQHLFNQDPIETPNQNRDKNDKPKRKKQRRI
jgi:hypothetical protein